MKSPLFLSMITILATTPFANASDLDLNDFTCSGTAEYGNVIINEVRLIRDSISITFTVAESQSTQSYVLTERHANGSTDAAETAYFIGATKSGAKNDYDDIALPHLGLYKSGIGSEIAFNINGMRVFGTVECK